MDWSRCTLQVTIYMESNVNTIHLCQVGDSVMLNIQPELIDHLKEGGRASIAMDNGHLTIKRETAPRYTLEELIAATDPEALAAAKADIWMTSGPVGRELL